MQKRLTLKEIPELPGYMPVAKVAATYGVHKGTVYYMIYNQMAFRHVFKVSSGIDGDDESRPLLLLMESEVKQVFDQRARDAEAALVAPLAVQLKEWNRRVKKWGVDQGWTRSPISKSGRPSRDLVAAYLDANPNDTRPE